MKLYTPFMRLVVLVCLVLTACSKTLPPDLMGEPAFIFKGSIDGQSTEIVAGEDAMRLEASWFRDGVGIDNYQGEFRPLNCAGCPGSLRITLRGQEASTGEARPGRDLQPGEYSFLGGVASQQDPKAFRFRAISQGVHPLRYAWIIEGDTLDQIAAPVHRFRSTGHQPVKLLTTDARGCQNQTEFRVPSGMGFCGPPFRFQYEKTGRRTVHFHNSVSIPASDIATVTWNFGDGTYAFSEMEPVHEYPRPGIYPVKLVVMDKDGCLHCDFQNVYSEPGNTCTSSILAMPVQPDGEPGKVTIQWWDENGREFNSDHIQTQSQGSEFRILAAESWETDPEGTLTWKVEAQLRCRLFATDGSDETVELVSEKLVLALGVE